MKRKRFLLLILAVLAFVLFGAWIAGTALTWPDHHTVGKLPTEQAGQSVEFPSESGSLLHGWFLPGEPGGGTIIVMHGVRASRLDMLDRAQFLSRAGYSVLLFDFQAHGESAGKQITFGFLESRDAAAAVKFARTAKPREKLGVIGVSMGGAAALLSSPPLALDALVLEQVYPTLQQAINDRISMRLGGWSTILAPLLSWQISPRLGISIEALRPLDHVGKISAPKLFIGGTNDRHTTPREMREMFDAAAEPKELWMVPEASHVDLCRFGKAEYQKRILQFFAQHLRETSTGAVPH
ncbi:MAG: uncharacterized protein QOH88_2924 [Verrucomicrobiota bacterium]|jgi:fermentation-respiration switch protein FrsA (DUF1100 family)